MVEDGGRESAVEPAPLAPVLGQRLEQSLGRPGAIRTLDDVDVGVEGAEEPDGLLVAQRVGSGIGIDGAQIDRLLVPANSVAK